MGVIRDLVVVGGGLSGLVAAWEAATRGMDVLLLEKDRPGGRIGRIWFGERYAETGAEFLDTNHTRVLHLARRFSIEVVERRAWMRLPRRFSREAREGFQGLFDRLKADGGRISDPTRPWEAPEEIRALDRQSLRDLADRMGLPREARELLRLYCLNLEAAEPEDVSVWGAVFQERLYALHPGESARYKVRGGLFALVEELVAAILREGGAVWSASPATRLTRHGDLWEIRTPTDRIRARRVILALPLSDLQKLPGVPEPLRDIRIPYGPVLKIFLHFAHRFWLEDPPEGEIQDRYVSALWDETDVQEGEDGILAVWVAGNFRRTWPEDPEGQVQKALEEVARMFPRARTAFLAGQAVHWPRAYPHIPPGGLSAIRTLWTFREEGLCLSGDHMSPFVGYAEGAAESAIHCVENLTGG